MMFIASAFGSGDPGTERVPGEPADGADRRDAANRLWAHVLHLDDSLIQRGNFFLIAESMALIAYGAVIAGPGIDPLATVGWFELSQSSVIALFGFVLGVMWLYVGHWHRRKLNAMIAMAASWLFEYRDARERRTVKGFSATAVIVYLMPTVVMVMWASLALVVG